MIVRHPLIANEMRRFLQANGFFVSREEVYAVCDAEFGDRGCSLADICRALRVLGAQVLARDARVTLATEHTPFLTLVNPRGVPYLITVLAIEAGTVHASHPSYGRWTVEETTFQEVWSGVAIRLDGASYVANRSPSIDSFREKRYRNSIRLIPKAFSEEECQELLGLLRSEPRFAPSMVTMQGLNRVSRYRTSNSVQLSEDLRPVQLMMNKVASLLPCDPLSFEYNQFVRYGLGDEFAAHFDRDTSHADKGLMGPRLRTCILYLDALFEGGETYFPEIDLKVTPETGSLLVFNNVGENGDTDELSLHCGLPVTSGIKHICILWESECPPVRGGGGVSR